MWENDGYVTSGTTESKTTILKDKYGRKILEVERTENNKIKIKDLDTGDVPPSPPSPTPTESDLFIVNFTPDPNGETLEYGYVPVILDKTFDEIIENAQSKIAIFQGMQESSAARIFASLMHVETPEGAPYIMYSGSSCIGVSDYDPETGVPHNLEFATMVLIRDVVNEEDKAFVRATNISADLIDKFSSLTSEELERIGAIPSSFINCFITPPTTSWPGNDRFWTIGYNEQTDEYHWCEAIRPLE